MLWGRATYEMMEGYWPAVARGGGGDALSTRALIGFFEAKGPDSHY
jgi:hypothetical protein